MSQSISPPTNGFHLLGKSPPVGWKPKEIIYSRLHLAADGTGVKFTANPDSQIICGFDVDDFVRDVALPNVPTNGIGYRTRNALDTDPGPRTPFDIYVGATCYVVIELDRSANWQFRADGPALTTKEPYGDDNCDLRHVAANGDIMGAESPGGDGCRIVFFSVTRREHDPCEHQRFNFHLEFIMQDGEQKGWKVPVIIDPDIPDDGGTIPFDGCSEDQWPSPVVPRLRADGERD